MSKVIAKRTGETGAIEEYKLDDGRILTCDQIVDEANKGKIEGVSSFTTRDGDMSVRSDRGQEGYSLQDLPEF